MSSRRPLIAIDLASLAATMTGIGYCLKHLMLALLERDSADYFQPHICLRSSNMRRVQRGADLHLGAGRVPAKKFFFPGRLLHWMPVDRAYPDLDLFHHTSPTSRLRTCRKPMLATVYDIAWLRLPPEICPRPPHPNLERYPETIRAARQVLCISETTRRDVHEVLGVPLERLHLAPLAARPSFLPPSVAQRAALAEKQAAQGAPYFVMLGTLEPRKNIPRVLEALASIRGKGFPHKLILAGMGGWGAAAVEQTIQRLHLENAVVRTGYLDDARILELLWGAEALVMPSLYEGFGMPALEALAAGTPVLASRAGSLPEVVEHAALLVNPLETEEIMAAMTRLIEDPGLRADLRMRGLIQAAKFTWQRTAEVTWNAYRRALD